MSETHIASVNSELFQIPGFKFVHKNRIAGEGGGVAMYLFNDLKWKRRTDIETDEIECIWVEVDVFKGKSFLVGCILRPPNSSSYLRRDFNKNLNEMLLKVNKVSMETFLLGDINVNYLVKSTRVTQETKSLIDVIMTNMHSNVHHTNVLPLSLSDHDCLMCVRKIDHRKMPFKIIT